MVGSGHFAAHGGQDGHTGQLLVDATEDEVGEAVSEKMEFNEEEDEDDVEEEERVVEGELHTGMSN